MFILSLLFISFSAHTMELENKPDTFNEPVIQPAHEKVADHIIITVHDWPVAPYLQKKYKNHPETATPRSQWRHDLQKRFKVAKDKKDPIEVLELMNDIFMTAAQETYQEIQEVKQNNQSLSLKAKISLGVTLGVGMVQLGLLAYLSGVQNS